jgi:hypothetical protein
MIALADPDLAAEEPRRSTVATAPRTGTCFLGKPTYE